MYALFPRKNTVPQSMATVRKTNLSSLTKIEIVNYELYLIILHCAFYANAEINSVMALIL